MDGTTGGPQQDTESQATCSSTAKITDSCRSICFPPGKLSRARILPIPGVPVGIGFAPILSGEIGHFIRVDGNVAQSWYFHDDGTEVSKEKEVGRGSNNEISFTG